MLREVILSATNNRLVSRGVKRYGMRLGADRFVPGETLDDAVRVIRELNARGFVANTKFFGEGQTDEAKIQAGMEEYGRILDRIATEQLDCTLAVKPTNVGLLRSEELAYRNLTRLAEQAERLGIFLRVEMEESEYVEPTIRSYRRLHAEGFKNTGVVLQSYLYRSERDLLDLLPMRPNVRLVKGAYLEPPEVAYPKKADVDTNYVRMAELALAGDGYTAIATHDDRIIEHLIAFTERQGIGRDRFEFQMLYGIRPQLQQDLVDRGYRVLIATSYGTEWYPWFMRRLAERPANVLFLLSNLFRR